MKGSAPNPPATGSHSLPTKKWKPNACHAIAERCISSAMISPTIPKITSAASNISQRKPLSALNSDRCQVGFLCEVVTSEILGDSDVPMVSLGGGPACRPLACGCEMETLLSGVAPITPTTPGFPAWKESGKVAGPLSKLAMPLLKDDELEPHGPPRQISGPPSLRS